MPAVMKLLLCCLLCFVSKSQQWQRKDDPEERRQQEELMKVTRWNEKDCTGLERIILDFLTKIYKYDQKTHTGGNIGEVMNRYDKHGTGELVKHQIRNMLEEAGLFGRGKFKGVSKAVFGSLLPDSYLMSQDELQTHLDLLVQLVRDGGVCHVVSHWKHLISHGDVDRVLLALNHSGYSGWLELWRPVVAAAETRVHVLVHSTWGSDLSALLLHIDSDGDSLIDDVELRNFLKNDMRVKQMHHRFLFEKLAMALMDTNDDGKLSENELEVVWSVCLAAWKQAGEGGSPGLFDAGWAFIYGPLRWSHFKIHRALPENCRLLVQGGLMSVPEVWPAARCWLLVRAQLKDALEKSYLESLVEGISRLPSDALDLLTSIFPQLASSGSLSVEILELLRSLLSGVAHSVTWRTERLDSPDAETGSEPVTGANRRRKRSSNKGEL